ncbi:hypothetical protein ACFYYP_18505 [Microbispora rosea]|uniref:hypothetical protein n=1 Tax=Microbispora rosea TaxID=58117 RepID=UPI00367DD9FE
MGTAAGADAPAAARKEPSGFTCARDAWAVTAVPARVSLPRRMNVTEWAGKS